jgi:hypothetical protein
LNLIRKRHTPSNSSLSSKMLCTICSNLDLDATLSLEGLQHHFTRQSAKSPTPPDCQFCALVYEFWLRIFEAEERYAHDHEIDLHPNNTGRSRICFRAVDSRENPPHAFSMLQFRQPYVDRPDELDVTMELLCEAHEGRSKESNLSDLVIVRKSNHDR